MPDRLEHPAHLANRRAKADRLILVIWSGLRHQDQIDPETVRALRTAPQETRDAFAAAAGEDSPSEKCWGMIVLGIGERVMEKRFRLDDHDHGQAA